MLRMEMRRVLVSRFFWIALAIGTVSLLAGLASHMTGYESWREAVNSGNPNFDPMFYNAFDAFLSARFGFISLLAPLLAALPFADSFALDKTSQFMRLTLPRAGRRRYMVTRLIVNAIAGGVVLVIPHLALYAATLLLLPQGLTTPEVYMQQRMIVQGPWEDIYTINPHLYLWIMMGLSFVFGCVYATIGLAAGCLTENRYVAVAAPLLAYIIGSFLLGAMGLSAMLPTVTFTPQLVTHSSDVFILGQLGVLMAVAVILYVVAARYRMEQA